MDTKKIYVLLTALLLGFFAIVQGRSYESVNNLLSRDARSNVFQEIRILKEKNEDLRKEIEELTSTTEQLTDQNSALAVIEAEIDKYKKLNGKSAIFGPGVEININGNITTPWAVDLINEFYNSGAQAVSLNGIRVVNHTAGLDTLPQGQILLNGSILSSPYVFNVIGESSDLIEILQLPGGIMERLDVAFDGLEVKILSKEVIKLD